MSAKKRSVSRRKAASSPDVDAIQRDLRTRIERATRTKHPEPGAVLGVECEYKLLESGRQLDFRTFFSALVDLADEPLYRQGPYCVLLQDGHKFCCDSWEAELATPPEPVGRDTPGHLAESVARTRNWFLELIRRYNRKYKRKISLQGYSTHLNIQSMMGCLGDDFARRFAVTYGPLFIFLTNRPVSRGIMSRPRPDRFELPVEYISETPRLRAAISLFTGAFLACLEESTHDGAPSVPALPRKLLQRSSTRYGSKLSPEAVSPELRKKGRRARLQGFKGFTGTLQDLLDVHWKTIRPHLAKTFSKGEQQLAREFVVGKRKCGMEIGRHANYDRIRAVPVKNRQLQGEAAFRVAMKGWEKGAWRLRPCYTHWNFTLFRARCRNSWIYLNLPSRYLLDFGKGVLDKAISGGLDSFAAVPPEIRKKALTRLADTDEPGFFTQVDWPALAQQLELSPGVDKAAKKKKKKKAEAVCVVLVDDEGNIDICIPETSDPQQAIEPQEPPQSEGLAGEDVWLHNGAFKHSNTDHEVNSVGFNFAFVRAYRSSQRYSGILGQNWDHLFNIRLVPEPPPVHQPIRGGWCERFNLALQSGNIRYHHGTGRLTRHVFKRWRDRHLEWCDADFRAIVTEYKQNDGEDFEITRYALLSGSAPPAVGIRPIFYRIRVRGGTRILLNCHGYVVEIRDRNHNIMRFQYDLPFNTSTKYFVLRKMWDTEGRMYSLDYDLIDGVPRIRKLTDFNSRVLEFHYDQQVQLERVELVKGDFGRPKIKYIYGGSRIGLLKGIVNPVEAQTGANAWLMNNYDQQERVIEQRVGRGSVGGKYKFDYQGPNKVEVTDRESRKFLYSLVGMGGTKVVERIQVKDEVAVGTQIRANRNLVTVYEHDRHYHVTQIRYPSGRREVFQYRNSNRRLRGTSAIPGEFDDADNRIIYFNDLGRDAVMKHSVHPVGGGRAFERGYQYDWLFGSVTRMTTSYGRTQYFYAHGFCSTPELNGNPTEIIHPRQRQPGGRSIPVVEKCGYGIGGVRTMYTDPDGIEQRWTVDGKGRVTAHSIGGTQQERYVYDDVGNVKERYDDRGKKWSFKYDKRDNKTKTTDPMGHTQDFTYDLNDRLITEKTELKDDAPAIPSPGAPALTTTQSTASIEITYTYDILGQRTQVLQVVGSLSRTWKWKYDKELQLVTTSTPRAVGGGRADAKTAYQHNRRGLVTHVTEGAGGNTPVTTRIIYDSDDRDSIIIDPSNQRHYKKFDGHGQTTKISMPNGAEINRKYLNFRLDSEYIKGPILDQPVSFGGTVRTRILRETKYEFDLHNRVIRLAEKVFNPFTRRSTNTPASGEAVTESKYTAAGRLSKVLTPTGSTTTYQYNAEGRIAWTNSPSHTVGYIYAGSQVATTILITTPDRGTTAQPSPAALAVTETKTFDDLGRVTKIDGYDNITEEYLYHSLGGVRLKRGPLGQTEYIYDGFNRLVEQQINNVLTPQNPDGKITIKFEYDRNDNIVGMWDDLGRKTTTTYDGRDQILSVHHPQTGKLTWTRGSNGLIDNIAKSTGGANSRVRYEYTEMGQVRRILYQQGGRRTEQVFGYDGFGRLTYGLDTNGTSNRRRVQVYRKFDSLGRATREQTIAPEINYDRTVRYSYNSAHNEKIIHYPGASEQFTYRFGDDGNLKEIHEHQTPILKLWHQGYGKVLESERRLYLRSQSPLARYTFRLREGLRYDAVGRLNQRSLRITDNVNRPGPFNSNANLLMLEPNQSLLHGSDGQINKKIFAQYTTEYRYDGAGRVMWSLDDIQGNRRLAEFERDGANQLHKIVTSEYRGSAVATRTTRNIRYRPNVRTRSDNQGSNSIVFKFNPSGTLKWAHAFHLSGRGVERDFTYDASDRLTRVKTVTPGAFGSTTVEADYLYDVFGRRIARLGGRASTAIGSRPRETFLFDGAQCIEEYNQQNRVQRQYLFDEVGQLIRYRYRDGSAARMKDTLPINMIDGSPWLLLQRDMRVSSLPTPPGASAAAVTRSKYYRDHLPVILERHARRPFEEPKILKYDYSSVPASSSVITESALPLVGSQRIHLPEQIMYNRRRFYEATLQGFITPDVTGAWGDPQGLGNPYTFGGNNPITMTDDGNAAWVVPVLLYLLLTTATATAETLIERGIHGLWGSGDFEWGSTWLRNFGLGLATNWIPYSSVGRIGGRIAASTALRAGVMFGAARSSYAFGRWGMRTVIGTGIEYGYEQSPLGEGSGLVGIVAGNLIGQGVGTALEKVIGRRLRRWASDAAHGYRLRRAQQWLRDPNSPVGSQVHISARHGSQLLREAARHNVTHEFGLIMLERGLKGRGTRRLVLRKGSQGSVDFDWRTELHLAHSHPSSGALLLHRLPAPRDIEIGSGAYQPHIISPRDNAGGEILSTSWSHRLGGEVRIWPEHLDDLSLFMGVMRQTGLGQRDGNALVFGRLKDYNHVFFAYQRQAVARGLSW